MRKLVYSTSLSLDGYIDSAAGDPSWGVPDEELHRHFNDVERQIDTLLYGRRMYEIMAGYWPTADQDPSAPGVIVAMRSRHCVVTADGVVVGSSTASASRRKEL